MRHANKVLGIVVAVALMLVYCCAYLSLVDRRVSFDSPFATAEYKIGGALASAVFLPAHSVDRLVRPRYWTAGGRAADPYDFEELR